MEAELILDEVDEVEVAKKGATMGLILGIIGTVVGAGSIFGCPWLSWLTLPASIYGLIKSIPAMKVPEASGSGTAGLILSIIGTVISGAVSIYALFITAVLLVYLIIIILYVVIFAIVLGAAAMGGGM